MARLGTSLIRSSARDQACSLGCSGVPAQRHRSSRQISHLMNARSVPEHLADEAVIDLGALRRIYEDRVIDEFVIGGRAPLQPDHWQPVVETHPLRCAK